MFPRPRSFGTKLLLLFVVVVAAAQLATWFLVSRTSRAQARALIDAELQQAARVFTRIVADRNSLLATVGTAAARDYAIKPLFTAEDPVTLGSALQSLRLQGGADVVTALGLDGRVLASTTPGQPAHGVLAELVERADADPGPNPRATGYGYLDGSLYSFVVGPVRSPDIVAWLVIGFRIDGEFARRLREQTGVEVSFLDSGSRLLASTLPAGPAQALAGALASRASNGARDEVPLGGETALVLTRRLAAGGMSHATLALHYSLDEKLRPAREAERWLVGIATGSLLAAAALSRAFARRLSRPITDLAAHTRRIAAGDYQTRLASRREDELGQLAQAFDAMSAGLEERDRVRDLLDKNVSPEVAAQLLRDGAALGGEEREVTILFADLRGFTTMSERLAPRELLTLLNRYLDRMSAEIEREGGVIDKYIGDAIMALFGAPVAGTDAADRALRAALAMERALAGLNQELAAEGKPPLGIGVGINTARVVAGNIGSHRRLNYSVIGDGVNVAARLQAETRQAAHATNIILSAATRAALRQPETTTLRDLGSVHVKGRAGAVGLFAAGVPRAS